MERKLWAGRTHWAHHAGILALGLLGIVLTTVICVLLRSRAGIVAVWAGVVLLITAVVAARVLWRVMYCRYRLTDQRLFIDRGILAQTTDQTELIRVDDVRIRKTLTDRLFGLGTVEVLSTDVSDRSLVIEGIRDPETIAEHLRANMRALRRKSLFIESL